MQCCSTSQPIKLNKMENICLKLMINRNNKYDLDKVTKLVREGWDIIHFDKSDEKENRDTKVVLVREM
jgi:predicted fused transcriptional regulator/phosphomethylpyrimidine kinase